MKESIGQFGTLHDGFQKEGFTLKEGELFDGYEVLEPIGKGGMGEVYRVKSIKNGQEFALKVLQERCSNSKIMKDRFAIEARIMASISHPNIVKVHHFSELNGRSYLIMDAIFYDSKTSCSLEDYLAFNGRLTEELIHDFLDQICETLNFLHTYNGAGIIHRDLKPENILIDKNKKLLLTDFGLVKINDEKLRKSLSPIDLACDSGLSIGDMKTLLKTGSPELTAEGSVMGTYDYMAPEIMAGVEASVQSDLYAVGVILYRMLTGEIPRGRFKSTSMYGCHESWDKVTMICLDSDISQRPESALKLNSLQKTFSEEIRKKAQKDIENFSLSINRAREKAQKGQEKTNKDETLTEKKSQKLKSPTRKLATAQEELVPNHYRNDYKGFAYKPSSSSNKKKTLRVSVPIIAFGLYLIFLGFNYSSEIKTFIKPVAKSELKKEESAKALVPPKVDDEPKTVDSTDKSRFLNAINNCIDAPDSRKTIITLRNESLKGVQDELSAKALSVVALSHLQYHDYPKYQDTVDFIKLNNPGYSASDFLKLEQIFRKCSKCKDGRLKPTKCRACKGSKGCPNSKCNAYEVKSYKKKMYYEFKESACFLCKGTGKCNSCEGKDPGWRKCFKCKGKGQLFVIRELKKQKNELLLNLKESVEHRL